MQDQMHVQLSRKRSTKAKQRATALKKMMGFQAFV
jgi:hypothetical protein